MASLKVEAGTGSVALFTELKELAEVIACGFAKARSTRGSISAPIVRMSRECDIFMVFLLAKR
jgi:hypothetical protein